jgi:hypothetical protein
MALCQSLKPKGEALRDFDRSGLQSLDPGQVTLKRTRQIYWRPANMQKTFGKAGRGHLILGVQNAAPKGVAISWKKFEFIRIMAQKVTGCLRNQMVGRCVCKAAIQAVPHDAVSIDGGEINFWPG